MNKIAPLQYRIYTQFWGWRVLAAMAIACPVQGFNCLLPQAWLAPQATVAGFPRRSPLAWRCTVAKEIIRITTQKTMLEAIGLAAKWG